MKSLRQALKDVSEEQLKAIYKLWLLDDGENSRQTRHLKVKRRFDALILRIRSAIATRFVWEQLAEDEQLILQRITAPTNRHGTPSNRLQSLTKLSAVRYEQALSPLIEYAFLQYTDEKVQESALRGVKPSGDTATVGTFTDNVDMLYQVSREFFTPSGDRSKWNLTRLIATLPVEILTHLKKTYDLQQRRSDYFYEYESADVIAKNMLALNEPLDYLSQLKGKPRELFTWLREQKGKADMATVQEALKVNKVELLDIVEELSEYALAFDTFSKGKHIVFIPIDLFDAMNSLVPGKELNEAPKRELEGEPAAVRASTYAMVYDIAMLISAIYQQTIEPTQAGKVPKRIATKLRLLLQGQPRQSYEEGDVYLEMLLNIMYILEIIILTTPLSNEEKPAYEVTSEIDAWRREPLLEQVHALASIWIEDAGWHDVYGANYKRRISYNWNITIGRKILLRQLHTYRPGHWYSVDALLQELWRDSLKTARQEKSPYPYATNIVQEKDTWEKWEQSEGEIYRGILASTLNEFGMIDVGYAQADALSSSEPVNPDYFLLTEFGAEVIKYVPSENDSISEEEPAQNLIVQPNFELLLLQLDLSTLYALLPLAQAQQISLVSRLVLTKASVLRGLQSGKSAEYILQTLRKHSQKEIPQNVDYTIRDWTKGFKSSNVSQVLLFEVSSEEAGQILTCLPVLQEASVRQLTPTIFAVSGNVELQKVRKELTKAEVFVRINGEVWTRPKELYRDFSIFDRY